MIRSVSAVLVLMIFAFGTSAQNSPPHQHVVAATTIIDGSKNPELIPDATAYRMWLLTVSLPANPTEQDLNAQQAHLAKLQLATRDYLTLQGILVDFKSRYVELINRYNESAKAQGIQADQTLFLQQRDDLVQITRTTINLRLPPDAATRVNAAVQGHKRFIQIHTSQGGQP